MNTILEAIEKIFCVGCGLEMQPVMMTERFAALAEHNRQLFNRFGENTQLGIALRAGHLVMGQLLNCFPEKEAIQIAKKSTHPLGHGVELRPLIQILGESIVAAAKQCLPPEVLVLAQEWKTATAERQIEIARELFFLFRSKSQGQEHEIQTTEKSMERIYDKLRERASRNQRVDDILPLLYGHWNENCPANCQGKSQMLTAFGRLAGAKVMTVDPLSCGFERLARVRSRLIEAISRDLRDRGLEQADDSLNEGRFGDQLEMLAGDAFRGFHVSVALELCDGRWILIDPHGLVWGVFSKIWGMNRVWKLLKKYGAVIPGLQLIRNDGGESEAKIEARFNESLQIIEQSRKLEQIIREQDVKMLGDLIRIVQESDDFDLLIKMHHEQGGNPAPDYLKIPEARELAVMEMISGGLDNLMSLSRMLDPEFCRQQIGEWLTFYHCIAANHLSNQLANTGEIMHPVAEFSANPEYHLAISAINSMLIRINGESQQFFVDYAFDQLTLRNALLQLHGERPDIGRAAAAALYFLPFVHDNIRKNLGRDC